MPTAYPRVQHPPVVGLAQCLTNTAPDSLGATNENVRGRVSRARVWVSELHAGGFWEWGEGGRNGQREKLNCDKDADATGN